MSGGRAGARDYGWILAAYAAGLAAAWATLRVPLGLGPAWTLAAADLAATVAVFAFSFFLDNTSVYDPYWSVMPPVLAAHLLWLLPSAHGAVALGAVGVWGARLTYNWVRGWTGLKHEDWRYVRFRSLGKGYWPMSFFGLQLLPSVMTFLGCLPLVFTQRWVREWSALDLAGVAVMLSATLVEAVADEQLRAFRRTKRADGEICELGLWRWSRHPNYFGELSFWAGVLLFGLGGGAPAWTAVGLVALVALFVFASIPMAEQRSLERRPGYAEHRRRVSMLLPWPPRR